MTTPAPAACSDTHDARLVKRAKTGERAAFDVLVTKYQRRIIKLTMRYTHDPCDAEDAAQEAFIKAYKGLAHFRGDCSFYTWLHRIAINSARNVLIARTRNPSTHADSLQSEEVDAIPGRLRDAETPESFLLTDDVRQTVRTALASLPDTHRVAIILREIDGLTYDEIAFTMGTPLGTVRSRISATLERTVERAFAAANR